MKKLLFLLISLLLVIFILCSCNKNTTLDTDPSSSETQVTETAPEETKKEYNDGKLRIFADGEYYCKIIRPEGGTKHELEIYVAVRNIFKEVTGVMPPLATDFKAHNEQYDSNEFAILIGKTGHDEAAAHYANLSYSNFSAELVNKKYVLGFHDIDTAHNALEKFKELLTKNFKNGELILDESWNFSHSEKELLEDIPRYDGGIFADVFESAYGMQIVSIQNTNANEYNSYLTKISTDGFTPYTDNVIGKNLFATYQNDKYVLTAMYLDSIGETRIILEKQGKSSLPALKEENVYTPTGVESSITQIGLEESTGRQNGMSYVIKLADGSFIVIDGGDPTQGAVDQFYEVMDSLSDGADNITIASWILTHAHNDHLGLLYMLINDAKFHEKFTVEQFIWSKAGDKQLASLGEGSSLDYVDQLFAKVKGAKVVNAHPGQQFFIRNAVYTVYSTINLTEPITIDNLNDTSMVGRLVIDGKSIMFPGDVHAISTDKIASIYTTSLKSDVVQVIHHGYQGGTASFYSRVDPLTVLWPLGMKNYSTAEAPNTPMKTWSYSAWLFSEDSNVQNIYVAGSEVLTLLIKDIPSNSPVQE